MIASVLAVPDVAVRSWVDDAGIQFNGVHLAMLLAAYILGAITGAFAIMSRKSENKENTKKGL